MKQLYQFKNYPQADRLFSQIGCEPLSEKVVSQTKLSGKPSLR
jgi:hypothetical protein